MIRLRIIRRSRRTLRFQRGCASRCVVCAAGALARKPPSIGRRHPEGLEASEPTRYGAAAAGIKHAEAFEIAEYGRHPSEQGILKLFPFFPAK